jgi:hypothetical protein
MITAEQIYSFSAFQKANEEKAKDVYANSPFRVIRDLSSSKKGKFFERIVEEYLIEKGIEVNKPKSKDYDKLLKVGDKMIRLEVKGSTLWEGGTHFQWSQIRPAQEYDIICFVAMYPDRIDFFGSTKEEACAYLTQQDENGHWKFNQHGGRTVNSGTFKLTGFPEQYNFLHPFENLIR